MTGVLLETRQVVKQFGGLRALNGVSLSVRPGEILGLVGPNGSGKSTLINVVSGYLTASAGEVWFGGQEISRWEAHRIAELGLIRTYQIPRPFWNLTVLDNVLVGAMFGRKHRDHEEARATAIRWLEFTGLASRAKDPINSLTLHQRKFLEMARALAGRPRLLLLDEVLAGLNPSEVEAGISLIRRIKEAGVTILMVEHIMRAIVSLSDRVAVLNFGEKIAEGRPEEVLRHPEVVSAYLGKAYA